MDTNSDSIILERIQTVLPVLKEKQARIYLSAEAQSLGWGGKSKIAKLSGASRLTIAKGEKESIKDYSTSTNGIRKPGGVCKKLVSQTPGLLQAIERIVCAHTMGDPMKPLLWVSKSLREITKELTIQGYRVSHETVRHCLVDLGYSLQSNKKTDEGGDVQDRDAQFEYINATGIFFMKSDCPVISVDCKKKELIGNLKNNGGEWREKKHPVQVKVYDFIDRQLGKAIPYGIYDIAKNDGFVNVGISSDTAEFAVNSIRTWWKEMGKEIYSHAPKLFITADSGGSNSSRGRLWKRELQLPANEINKEIYASHPPGTSKWKKIEHRMFSFISKNWRAKPLTSIEVVVNLIANTTTGKGLKINAKMDKRQYQKAIKITDQEMESLNIKKNEFKSDWNYIISP